MGCVLQELLPLCKEITVAAKIDDWNAHNFYINLIARGIERFKEKPQISYINPRYVHTVYLQTVYNLILTNHHHNQPKDQSGDTLERQIYRWAYILCKSKRKIMI